MSQSYSQRKQSEMNRTLMSRNESSQPLQPYLESRATGTRYTLMPVVPGAKPESSVKLKVEPVYNMSSVDAPGVSRGPWSGYASNVNLESELRNQIFALQRCEQSAWVPSSDSELYALKPIARPTHAPTPPSIAAPKLTTSRIYPTLVGDQQYQLFNASSRLTEDPRK